MANELTIEIGSKYELNGNKYILDSIQGPYFILVPLVVDGRHCTSLDGSVAMKAVEFSKAKLIK